MKYRVGLIWIAVGSALALFACSSANSVERPASTSTFVQRDLLPGETLRDAFERIFRSCLDSLEIPYEMVEDYHIKYRGTPDLSGNEIEAICAAELNASGLVEDRPRNTNEIKKDHQRLAKWTECLKREGYHPGPLISLDEYLASGGVANPLPEFDSMMASIRTKAAWDQLAVDCPQW